MTKMNKSDYMALIRENITWLLQQPDTLERSHIHQIVEASIHNAYEQAEELAELRTTVESFAMMLGWSHIPTRDVLEKTLRSLKAVAKNAGDTLLRAEEERRRLDGDLTTLKYENEELKEIIEAMRGDGPTAVAAEIKKAQADSKYWEDKFVALEMKRANCCDSNEQRAEKAEEEVDRCMTTINTITRFRADAEVKMRKARAEAARLRVENAQLKKGHAVPQKNEDESFTKARKLHEGLANLRHHFMCRCEESYTSRQMHSHECRAYELPGIDELLKETP